MLLSTKTIECNMRLDVVVDNVEFSARGKYVEQVLPKPVSDYQRSMFRQDLNFLMDMPATPGSEPNRLTIVCHASADYEKGRIWRYRSVEGNKSIDFIRLAALETAIKRSKSAKIHQTAVETWNLGGLAGMLKQVDRFYEITEFVETEELEGMENITVWKIVGKLRKPYLDAFAKKLGGIDKKGKYPNDLPSDVELYLGQGDRFPYKIRYLNRSSETSFSLKKLSEITYFDVLLDGEEIPEFHFMTFDRGEMSEGVFEFQDATNAFIRSLGIRP